MPVKRGRAKEKADSIYYFADDVMALLEVKDTKAYSVIKKLNGELRAMGIDTLPGRVPKTYFHLRYDVDVNAICKDKRFSQILKQEATT